MRSLHFRKRWLIVVVFFGIAVIYLFNIYSYLSPTVPVQPGILIVDGWLDHYELEKAKDEFLRDHYQLLITTGRPYYKGFPMGTSGKMAFNLDHQVNLATDSIYHISVELYGTRADGESAHFRILADSIEVGENFTSIIKKEFSYQVKLDTVPGIIIIDFDNDDYTRNRDRDLFIFGVTVNKNHFPVNSENVSYYSRDMTRLMQVLSHSQAIAAANFLKSSGIPDSLIIPVETTRKIKSKTYTYALDVKSWLDQNGYDNNTSLTIFTEGIHARRSLISFKKAFGNEWKIGVLSSPSRTVRADNWYKRRAGWSDVLYETIGIIFAWFFL